VFLKRPLICVVLITILISAARIYFYDPPKIDKVFSDEADTEIQGTVYQISKKTKGYAIYLKNISYMSVNQKVKDDICKDIHHILVYYDSCDGIYLGNTVKICGTLKKLQKGTVPGQFNEFLYYKAKGVDYKVFAKSVLVVNPKLSYYRQFLYQLKDKGTCIFEKYLNDENAGILSAIILGEKSELDAETKALYLKSGIAHILAISGLHISMIGLFLYRILKKLFMPNEIVVPVTIMFLVSYGWMTDFSVSTNRAVVMLSISLIAILIGRTYDIISSMCLSAVIILIQEPFQLVNSGFQLSYGAIIAVVSVYPCIRSFVFPSKVTTEKEIYGIFSFFQIQLKHTVHNEKFDQIKIIDKAVDSLLLSSSIILVTLPVLLWNYSEISFYSVFLNIFVLPLVPVLLGTGIGLLVVGNVSLWISYLFTFPIQWILAAYHVMCDIVLVLPFSILTIGKPSIYQVVGYYIILSISILLANIRENWKYFGFIVISVFCIVIKLNTSQLTITAIDVGQGDSFLIQKCGGTTIMIDSGSSSEKELTKYKVVPFFKSRGIRTLDYAIITHSDEDHVSAIKEIMETSNEAGSVRIKNFVMPRIAKPDENYVQLEQTAKENGVTVSYIEKGNCIKAGNLELKCLHPYDGFVTDEANDYSTVLSLHYKDFSMLFTGDVSNEGENALIENEELGHHTVYKVAHHGSKYTNNIELLEKISPKYAIISAGKNNRYGHPHEETLERLKEEHATIFTTIDRGSIEIRTDGEKMNVFGYFAKDGNIFSRFVKITK
jgi:competence protein ComEC